MALLWFILSALAVGVFASNHSTTKQTLIWEDNFDKLDESKWHHMVTAWDGGNAEFQYYRNWRKNSFVEDGILKIKPTPATQEKTDAEIRYGSIYDPTCNYEPCVSQSGPDATAIAFSARIKTQGTFDFKYGKVVVRARLPRGDFIWPAIWMMPAQDWYGVWPRSGEIDIMESRGNEKLHDAGGRQQGVHSFGSTMHWGPDQNNNAFAKTHWEWRGKDLSEEFHRYICEWTPDHIKFFIDDEQMGHVAPPAGGFWHLGGFQGNNLWASGSKMAPFDRPFYLMLNVAVGGHFFDGLINEPYGTPWDWGSGVPRLQFYENQQKWHPTWTKPAMEIDFVRVYKLE